MIGLQKIVLRVSSGYLDIMTSLESVMAVTVELADGVSVDE